MKNIAIQLCVLFLILGFVSCEKDLPEPAVTSQKGSRTNPTTPGGKNTGDLVVFATNNNGCATSTEGIDVYIDGEYAGKLEEFFPVGAPACGDAGTVTKSLTPGAHIVSGKCSTAFWPERKSSYLKDYVRGWGFIKESLMSEL